jgi:hypothetical protein
VTATVSLGLPPLIVSAERLLKLIGAGASAVTAVEPTVTPRPIGSKESLTVSAVAAALVTTHRSDELLYAAGTAEVDRVVAEGCGSGGAQAIERRVASVNLGWRRNRSTPSGGGS